MQFNLWKTEMSQHEWESQGLLQSGTELLQDTKYQELAG